MNRLIFSFVISVSTFVGSISGYGEKTDTLFLWQEQAVAVLTNACRMAPLTFRDRYIGNNSILLPENYPEVGKLLTVGEGNCTEDIASYSGNKQKNINDGQGGKMFFYRQDGKLILSSLPDRIGPLYSELIDGKGRKRMHVFWKDKKAPIKTCMVPYGIYIICNYYSNGSHEAVRLILQR